MRAPTTTDTLSRPGVGGGERASQTQAGLLLAVVTQRLDREGREAEDSLAGFGPSPARPRAPYVGYPAAPR
jgi:hypothetical protein